MIQYECEADFEEHMKACQESEHNSLEEFMKQQVIDGYCAEDGEPLKCICGCRKFKTVDVHYGEGWVEEYSLECKNLQCSRIVGTWSYGHWQV